MIDKLREELAHNKQKQQKLQEQLKIPDFNKNERVEIDENDVSDDES